MKLYHASPSTLPAGDCLRTKTGRGDGCIVSGGAVYMTDTPEACARYGIVHEVECTQATPYRQALAAVGRSKKPRYTSGVYVARPCDTKIKGVYR